ncbi:MAG: hypothetical protein JNJ40_11270 [Bacteroidia bacterium]|nr:hypothetical protein [Bacteroidia bacterium]
MVRITCILICFTFLGKSLAQNFKKLEHFADSLYNAEQYKKAILIYTKMLALQPKSFETYSSRGYSYFYSKNYKNAIADAGQGLALKPSIYYEDKFIRLKGYSFFYWEKYYEAIKFLSEDLVVNLQEYYSYLLRGRAYYETENYQKAISDLRVGLQDKMIDKDNKVFALVTIGLSYLYMDSISKIAPIIKEIKAVDSTCNDIDLLKGRVSYYKEDYAGALGYYNEAYKKDTISTGILESIAHCNYYLKNYDTAVNQFKVCDKKEKGNSGLNNMISWTLFLQKKYNEALPYADKAILYDKLNAPAYDTRGCVLYKTGLYSKAITDFNKCLQLDSTIFNSYYFRGSSFLKTNNKKEACADFQKLNTEKDYKVMEGEILLNDLLEENCR